MRNGMPKGGERVGPLHLRSVVLRAHRIPARGGKVALVTTPTWSAKVRRLPRSRSNERKEDSGCRGPRPVRVRREGIVWGTIRLSGGGRWGRGSARVLAEVPAATDGRYRTNRGNAQAFSPSTSRPAPRRVATKARGASGGPGATGDERPGPSLVRLALLAFLAVAGAVVARDRPLLQPRRAPPPSTAEPASGAGDACAMGAELVPLIARLCDHPETGPRLRRALVAAMARTRPRADVAALLAASPAAAGAAAGAPRHPDGSPTPPRAPGQPSGVR